MTISNQDNKKDKYVQSAIRTIKTEIEGLDSLIDFFKQDNFSKAIDLILNTSGKVIVSGMGKSGHIAKKIAATLASTGTPSFFIHPGEASHGDLGMITKNDIVILLSNSGETKELRDIIYYCVRIKIPFIGIARNHKSELIDASDIPLALPNIPEANLVNAPTTSTTMMIALGDAIAVALMEAKSFSNKEYGIFHPGGKLGSQFIKVKDLMRKDSDIPLINENKLLPKILFEMTSKHLGCVGILNKENNLAGIITDGDLRRSISSDFIKLKASQLMTKKPIVISEDMLVVEAVALMNEKSITNLFVVNNVDSKEGYQVSGILHIHDCLRAGIS